MVDTAAVPAPPNEDPAELAKEAGRWIAELTAAEKDPDYQEWLRRCKEIDKIWREKRPQSTARKRFALFWSNINTLAPAIYARTPTAIVSRRFKDSDPVGRVASEVLERSLNYSLEVYDFGQMMNDCRDDYLLFAQGQSWVRYVPTFKTVTPSAEEPPQEQPSDQLTDVGDAYEQVTWEEVCCDHLSYDDYLHNVARKWSEVWWNSRRAYLTRTELKARFGDKLGAVIPLDWKTPGRGDVAEGQQKAAIYEIWDKTTKTVFWISKSYSAQVLDKRPDPLGLVDFFPCPRPLFGTLGRRAMVPIPDYVYYQDQLDEIDLLTGRIESLIGSLKVKGFYASSIEQDLNSLLQADNNTLIPVESWAALTEKGGLQGMVDWFPLDKVVGALKECFETRQRLISDVYQVTGISDIMRGDTDANETAAAQKIKATWGSSRVRDRQKEMARFARDLLRIKGQIIAGKFGQQTLAEVTGLQLLTKEQQEQMAQQYQAQASLAQQQGQQPPPPPPQLSEPTWDDVMQLLQRPALRSFRLDIETDSTIEPNDQEEKARRIEFITAIGKYLAESLPVVQAQPSILPIIAQGLLWLVRGFRVGREMEDEIERAMTQLQQGAAGGQQQQAKGPDPQTEQMKAQAANTQSQAAMIQAQAAQGRVQVEGFKAQSDHTIGMAQVQAENTRTAADAHLGIHDLVAKAEERRAMQAMNSNVPITADQQ